MAWSFAARRVRNSLIRRLAEGLSKEWGRTVTIKEARVIAKARGMALPDPNDWREALRFARAVRKPINDTEPEQLSLLDYGLAA